MAQLPERFLHDLTINSNIIPNMEIRSIFTEQIMAMFKEDASKDGETLGKNQWRLEKPA